jgi:heat shock protein HtpX
MAVSFLPALFMYIGYSLMFSSMTSGAKKSGGNSALIGIAFMAFSWVLNLFTLWLSRIREYFADRNSVSVVDNGAWKLSTALAKIVSATRRPSRPQSRGRQQSMNAFKALFIADPDSASAAARANIDGSAMVQEILSRKITSADNLAEALSTHPNITKRLRALQQLSQNPNA